MSAQQILKDRYPCLSKAVDRVGEIPKIIKSDVPLEVAVTKIIIGQMLSMRAADSIYQRMAAHCEDSNRCNSWDLSESALREIGLSWRKIRTIKEFGELFEDVSSHVHTWEDMEYEELKSAVASIWGLSSWSADMLAIFHFGHEDIFPKNDGTINRVLKSLYEQRIQNSLLDPNLARPYRSYYAVFLYRLNDLPLTNVFDAEA